MRKCKIPPKGWYCAREKGHDGPCAARPAYSPQSTAKTFRYRFWRMIRRKTLWYYIMPPPMGLWGKMFNTACDHFHEMAEEKMTIDQRQFWDSLVNNSLDAGAVLEPETIIEAYKKEFNDWPKWKDEILKP